MRWDLVAAGEVMLRLDPGVGRIATTRTFQVWEGGGEYNVARGLRRCFGLRTAVVTALADNPVGRLVEDLLLQGGVDISHLRWASYDGIGRSVRNGLNFTERGFGARAALGCSDRAQQRYQPVAAGRSALGRDLSGPRAPAGSIPAVFSPGCPKARPRWPPRPCPRRARPVRRCRTTSISGLRCGTRRRRGNEPWKSTGGWWP